MTFSLVFDEAQAVSEAYAIESMPYSVLIDRSGKVRYIHKGYKPGDEVRYVNVLKGLLRGGRCAAPRDRGRSMPGRLRGCGCRGAAGQRVLLLREGRTA